MSHEQRVVNERDVHNGYERDVEVPPIVPHTAEAYLDDNFSQNARVNLERHAENARLGLLVYEIACGDAREDDPMFHSTIIDRRIAAGADPDKARRPFSDSSVQFAAIRPHYAGSTALPGKMPTGCGGHEAVAGIIHQQRHPHTDPLLTYAETRIAHTDPIIHTLKLARRLARTSDSGKPVILMPYDHETGESKVVAFLHRDGNTMVDVTSADFHVPLDGQYDPALVYANGVPDLNRDYLPDIIRQHLEEYDIEVNRRPLNTQSQFTQDPGVIMLTTELRDSNLWLPQTYQRPNTGFRLTLYKNPDGTISNDDQSVALAQARYVLRYSVNNTAIPNAPFHSTKTAAIFTDNYDQSRELASRFVYTAQDLSEHDRKPSWFALPERRLIIGEVVNGVIQRIGEVEVQVRDNIVRVYEEKEIKI